MPEFRAPGAPAEAPVENSAHSAEDDIMERLAALDKAMQQAGIGAVFVDEGGPGKEQMALVLWEQGHLNAPPSARLVETLERYMREKGAMP